MSSSYSVLWPRSSMLFLLLLLLLSPYYTVPITFCWAPLVLSNNVAVVQTIETHINTLASADRHPHIIFLNFRLRSKRLWLQNWDITNIKN
ncbi:hypothetical protein L228DRAFT_251041 [Xylona heveae TC161]|uniref:Uncharacterized protein n=1 Tax=Xylona heveae (strain CBS 132557 / TC161) TaxID=1328760 RepID=A0A164ZS98_XYLHT|nr:hypothetical protein L228DRAFT_251041 [Xylona heveae TC161]KZF19449.1 hypothetical protein L228DRAFT_251041 [Xylona heveae TC161]